MTILNESEAAARLGLSLRTLQRFRENDSGPAYHRFGKRLGYTLDDLEKFMKRHRHDAYALEENYEDDENILPHDNSRIN